MFVLGLKRGLIFVNVEGCFRWGVFFRVFVVLMLGFL